MVHLVILTLGRNACADLQGVSCAYRAEVKEVREYHVRAVSRAFSDLEAQQFAHFPSHDKINNFRLSKSSDQTGVGHSLVRLGG